jgi:hypothetical protein
MTVWCRFYDDHGIWLSRKLTDRGIEFLRHSEPRK